MSTFYRESFTCAVCGKEDQYGVVGSTNAFGSADLDLRPPEMERSTMPAWVQQCPRCGYAAECVDRPTTVTIEFLKRPEYLSCDGIEFRSGLAARFYRQYMVGLHDNDKQTAFNALLHAAWACDDSEDSVNATACRLKSLPILTELISTETENADTLRLMKADIMRRAGLFEELKAEYAGVSFTEELLNKILAFQLARAEEGDRGCYRVIDVDRGA